MPNTTGWFSDALNGAGVAVITTPVEATDPAAGSALSVHVFWQPEDGSEPAVTDTAGNTYALEASVNGANRRGRAFVAKNIETSADFQITVTWATAQFANAVTALEVVGADADAPAGVSGGQYQGPGVVGAGNTSSGTLSAPAEDGHLVHASSSSNSWPDTYEVDSPLTEISRIAAPGYVIHGAALQGTAAAATSTFTQDNTASTLTLVTTIKPQAEAPESDPPLPNLIVEFQPT